MPKPIKTVNELEGALSAPDDALIGSMRRMRGDLLLAGAGGKMGPTLARMARRASDAAGVERRVIAVSRFSDDSIVESLMDCGVEAVRCDLLDRVQVDALPDSENVLFMTGMKFGAGDNPGLTWAMNTVAPANVCERFRDSRITAFSTGNVYGMTSVEGGGSRETDAPAPDGEYAMSAVGRERVFEHYSRAHGVPVSLIRLNYACELRYGVLVDIANWVWNEEPVPLATGYVNAIWQRDANALTLRAFDHAATPPFITNVAGAETLRVRDIANEFGARLGKHVQFRGTESDTAYLSNTDAMTKQFGADLTPLSDMLDWIAAWIERGGPQHGKPTRFDVRSGSY